LSKFEIEIREVFLEHLTLGLGYTRAESKIAWNKAQAHFPSYNPMSHSNLLTLEVATKDILKGEFRPELAEVEVI